MNEVKYEYDENGLLAKEFSNPSGALTFATTLHIGYTYDTAQSGELFTKKLRPLTMTYPSGKTLTYDYGIPGSADDLLNRYSIHYCCKCKTYFNIDLMNNAEGDPALRDLWCACGNI